MRAALAAAGLIAAAMLAAAGTAAAHDQDCGEAVVCADVDPRIDPQVGPVVDQIGPNEFDLEGIFR
jgi:hypothetical protein